LLHLRLLANKLSITFKRYFFSFFAKWPGHLWQGMQPGPEGNTTLLRVLHVGYLVKPVCGLLDGMLLKP
jgi:hypothetical protein